MHEHNNLCEHELKFCPHCDTVYCEKCKAEWKKPQMALSPLPPAPVPEAYKVTCNDTTCGIDPTQPATIPIDISNFKKV